LTLPPGEKVETLPDATPALADWQLPAGVNRGVWEYVHDRRLARTYDDSLRDCGLLQIDQTFVERHCTAPGRVIDLGCGTGRVLIPLAQRGHWVLGVDLSQEMLAIAREKALAAHVSIQCLRANVVELDGLADGSFDCALCLFSTLGMIAGRAPRRRLLAQVHRLLRPGGTFLLHAHNRWFNFWDPQGRQWLFRDIGRALLRSASSGDRDMPAHDGQGRLTLHLFTRREICRLLRHAGFQIVEVKPVSLRPDGSLARPWWFGWLRSYGYLIGARRRG
jgi:SAM-dependent methyltransferase